ncbi:MAG: type II toxin-antitoxin system VapC family toxin [Actinobacteria bacterium]|nr:type II toxin-antitoxin system VapC family toxin [Actinomycetota bacterium]
MSCFLDTHIIIWLYEKRINLLSEKAKKYIEENDLLISPIVNMEIEYLFEIEKIKDNSETILGYLEKNIGLRVQNSDFKEIIKISLNEKWTRDPFDRIIVAHAKYMDLTLISKDEKITKNYFRTIY